MTIPLSPQSFRIHPAPGRLPASPVPVAATATKAGRGYRVIRRVRVAPATVPQRVSLWQRVLNVLHPSIDAEQLHARQSSQRALHQESWRCAPPILLGGHLAFFPGTSLFPHQGAAGKGGLS